MSTSLITSLARSTAPVSVKSRTNAKLDTASRTRNGVSKREIHATANTTGDHYGRNPEIVATADPDHAPYCKRINAGHGRVGDSEYSHGGRVNKQKHNQHPLGSCHLIIDDDVPLEPDEHAKKNCRKYRPEIIDETEFLDSRNRCGTTVCPRIQQVECVAKECGQYYQGEPDAEPAGCIGQRGE